jgi:hypothetical protein
MELLHPNAYDVTNFCRVFFADSCMGKIISHFCKVSVGHCRDPIAETVCVMLSSPVQMSITQIGVVPFKNHPIYIFPFRFLTPEQLEFFKGFVVFTKDDCVHSTASTQIGGGCMLCRCSESKPHYLDAFRVLSSMCDGIMGCTAYPSVQHRVSICNIMIQRIGTIMSLHRALLNKLSIHLETISGSATDACTDPKGVHSGFPLHTPV